MAEDRTPRTISPGETGGEIEEPMPRRRRKLPHAETEKDRSRVSQEHLLQPSDDSERAAERGPGNRLS